MSRPIHPSSVAAPNAAVPWLIVAAAGVTTVASTALWAAGNLVSSRGDHPTHVDFSPLLIVTVPTKGDGVAATWPGSTATSIWTVFAILTVLLLAPLATALVFWWNGRRSADSPHRSLAGKRSVGELTLDRVQANAARLRPSLAGCKPKDLAAGEVGVVLGRLDTGKGERGPLLLADWEAATLAIFAARSGKTSTLGVPTVLSAPGAVVATSNKIDLLPTIPLRTQRTGQRAWVFDPQGLVASRTQDFWWNPLAEVATVQDATRLASHFVAALADKRSKDIWGQSATTLLGDLLLAAALDGKPIDHVYTWLSDDTDATAAVVLADHGFDTAAASVRSITSLHPETRGSVYFTARAATACLRDPAITSWVTPRGRVAEQFRPGEFVVSRQTLYLLAKDSGGSAAPLVAALVDRILHAGIKAAEAAGGRLDPPLTVVLDEAASVCPLNDLPRLLSHTGSRGIFVCTFLQSYPQGEEVWGRDGMKELFAAATVKLIGSGQDDPAFNESVSKLVGEHDVAHASVTAGGARPGSVQTSVRRQRILEPAALRALPKGRAILLATGTTPAMIRLQPWYLGADADALNAATGRLTRSIAEAVNR